MIIYAYVMTRDTGFAPCYDNGKFTLACCKPRIRRSVFGKLDDSGKFNDDVWVIGAKHDGPPESDGYKSYIVYIAHITKVLRFEDYYIEDNNNRADCIYHNITTDECENVIKNKDDLETIKKEKTLKTAPDNPHYCNTDEFRKDISGLCVLCSDDFYYFGNGENSRNQVFTDVFEHCKKRRPGDFFYANIDEKQFCEVLKQFKKQGLKNKNDIEPIDKEKTCKKCSC